MNTEDNSSQSAVRTTIVGGRPSGPGRKPQGMPQGIEVLIKKASVDADFKNLLLERRGSAAEHIAIELSEEEVVLLNTIPRVQLEGIIERTKIKPANRTVFLGKVGVLMLAAVAAGIAGCQTPDVKREPGEETELNTSLLEHDQRQNSETPGREDRLQHHDHFSLGIRP